jgi:hypothetical protein
MFILFALPIAQHLAPRAWILQQRLSSLSHRASNAGVSGIIRDFHFGLPGTVEYTLTHYFSTRKSAKSTFQSMDEPEGGSKAIRRLASFLI